jgi:hypothetical protein
MRLQAALGVKSSGDLSALKSKEITTMNELYMDGFM